MNKLNIGARPFMWSRLAAVGAGISDGLHDLIQRLEAGFRRGSGKRGGPRLRPSSRPGVRIGPVFPVTVIVAFRHGTLIDEGSKGPALKGPVCGPGSDAGL